MRKILISQKYHKDIKIVMLMIIFFENIFQSITNLFVKSLSRRQIFKLAHDFHVLWIPSKILDALIINLFEVLKF